MEEWPVGPHASQGSQDAGGSPVTQVAPPSAGHRRRDHHGLHVAPSAPHRPPAAPARGYPFPPPQIPSGRPLRGRHATANAQGFGRLVWWTIVGSIVPGAGLIAAGRRTAGRLLVTLTVLALGGVVAFAVLGDLTSFALGLAADTNNLMIIALGAVALALLWAFVVLGTHVSLRRFTSLTSLQRMLSTLLVIAIIAGGGMVAYETANYSLIGKETLEAITSNGVQISGAPRPKNGQTDPWAGIPRVNVLLIGSDAGADRIGVRTDSILLASIDTHTGDAVIFGLPRNLQHVPFPEGTPMAQQYPNGFWCQDQSCLLNALWQYGSQSAADPSSPAYSYYRKFKNPGLQATIDAVQAVTGLPVNDYLLLDLAGFSGFVNSIGGIDINVKRPIPIAGHEDQYGHQVGVKGYIQPGHRHLNGYLTLWYARSRSDSSDYDRMQRQRCVISALSQQTNPVTLAKGFPELAKTIQKDISTSINLDDLRSWVTLALRVKKGHVRSLPFTDAVISTANPDFDKIHQLVQKALQAPSKSASTKPSPSSSSSATKPGTAKAPADPTKAVDTKDVC
jgi:polyisoprenyl-teichoic acid--peptidoglycan teichoic acid transferase